jgi:exodeoxyribonuclease VII small subunit
VAEVTFEQQMRDLEQLVGQLEHGELSLDEALKAFERGTKLVAACKAQLAQAEMKVEKVINAAGETAEIG